MDSFDQQLAYKLGLAWGGGFWDLRQALTQTIADRALYEGWRGLADQDPAAVVHSFAKNVAAQLETAAGCRRSNSGTTSSHAAVWGKPNCPTQVSAKRSKSRRPSRRAQEYQAALRTLADIDRVELVKNKALYA
jgi:hypothetical protein